MVARKRRAAQEGPAVLTRSSKNGSLRVTVSLAILLGVESSTRARLEIGRAGCRYFPSKLGFSTSALERLTLGRTRTSPLISVVLPLRVFFDGGTFSTGRPDKGKKQLVIIFEAST
jgi:hypothetical protein